jgi:RNA polymerase sigma factor for flagellar operon FliA
VLAVKAKPAAGTPGLACSAPERWLLLKREVLDIVTIYTRAGKEHSMSSVATLASHEREQMILEHLSQVNLLARRVHRRCPQGVELDDLISAGTIGLVKAVDRYDPRRCKLSTLAEHRINGAILDYLRQLDPLPRNIRQLHKRSEAVAVELENQLRRTPSESEIAKRIGITPGSLARVREVVHAANVVSLDALPTAVAEIGGTPVDVADGLDYAARMDSVRKAVQRLPRAERTVIQGLVAGESLREIAASLGAGPSRVSQLKSSAIVSLREALRSDRTKCKGSAKGAGT